MPRVGAQIERRGCARDWTYWFHTAHFLLLVRIALLVSFVPASEGAGCFKMPLGDYYIINLLWLVLLLSDSDSCGLGFSDSASTSDLFRY